jgi:hypothetical protein
MSAKKSDVSADTSPEPGAPADGTVRLTCLSPFEGPEGSFVLNDTIVVTAATEAEAQERADFLVSTLHVARRLPGEAA